MRITFTFLLIVVSTGLNGLTQTDSAPRLLEPGKPVQREISGKQSHLYRLTTPAGRLVRFMVEQSGVDIALSRLGPHRERLLRTNQTNIGGQESFSYLEAEAGEQEVEVRIAGSLAASGLYRVWIEITDTPGPKEIERASAEQMLATARLHSGEEAIESLEHALSLYRLLKDDRWEMATLNELGRSVFEQNRFADAVSYSARALTLSLSFRERTGEIDSRSILADSYSHSNRPEKAIEQYEALLPLYRAAQNSEAEGSTLADLSDAYTKLGLSEHALRAQEQSLAAKITSGDREGVGLARYGLGRLHHAAGRYETAVECYQQALLDFRASGAKNSEALALNRIGLVAIETGEKEKALQHLGQGLRACRESGDLKCESEAHRGLGRVHASNNEQEQARKDFEQALSLERAMRNRSLEVQTLYRLAEAERRWGGLDRAKTLLENAIHLLETVSADVFEPDQTTFPGGASQQVYELYVDLLMRLDRTDPEKGFDSLALIASEKARHRRQAESLAESRFDLGKNVDRSMRDQLRKLRWRMDAISRQLAHRGGAEQTIALQKDWDRLEAERDAAAQVLRRDSPRYAALMDSPSSNLQQIQQELDAETLLLEFWLGDERSFLWALGPDSIQSFELPSRRRIEEAAIRLYENLSARSRSIKGEMEPQTKARVTQADQQLPAAARVLSQMLLGPVADQLKTKRLVIVADGALHYTPFAMLPPPKVESVDGKANESDSSAHRETESKNNLAINARFGSSTLWNSLIVDHEIVYSSSASSLASHRKAIEHRQTPPNDIAILADPVLSADDKRIRLISAKPASQATTGPQNLIVTSIFEQLGQETDEGFGNHLAPPRLAFGQMEADRILSASPAGSTNLRSLGFLANRTTATSAHLSQYRYLHFAAYGLLDGRTPSFSTLVLSLVDQEGKSQNGLFRPADIYDLDLPAELVVLSACQAKPAVPYGGDAVLAFPDSFMYAGAARAAISLWNTNNKSSTEFMSKFYQKMLRDTLSPAGALRATQLDMMRQRQWQAPFYWAGLSLYGEWR